MSQQFQIIKKWNFVGFQILRQDLVYILQSMKFFHLIIWRLIEKENEEGCNYDSLLTTNCTFHLYFFLLLALWDNDILMFYFTWILGNTSICTLKFNVLSAQMVLIIYKTINLNGGEFNYRWIKVSPQHFLNNLFDRPLIQGALCAHNHFSII